MGDKVWVQCQCCGELHKVKTNDTSDEDVFIYEYCPKCRDETKHLLIGEHQDDVYVWGNANLDPRYY